MKVIYLGTGGFWTTEAVYKRVRGVEEVIPGYMGGIVENPSHEVVSTGTTGHVEVVKIVHDETVIDTDSILRIFFAMHDVSAPNHAMNGIGSQYRSVIFYTDDDQGEATDPANGSDMAIIHAIMEEVKASLPEGFSVATQAMTATIFYPADESHYGYYDQDPAAAYAATVITPKIEAARSRFPQFFITD